MFKIKKIMSLALACSMVLSMGATAFASDDSIYKSEYNVIITDEFGNVTYANEIGATDDVPLLQEDVQTKSSINVTASDVWKRIDYQLSHGYEYWAEGYVTAAEYHYASAQMWSGSTQIAAGFKRYGTGQVWSRSYYCWSPNAVAKIFYGSN